MTTTQRATAERIITDKGQTVSIAGTASAAYDPATGTTTPTAYSKTTTAVVLPLSHARKIDGTLIKQGDETMLISALDTSGAAMSEPPTDSVVTLADSTKRKIIAIEQLAPAGLIIMYDAVVRRTQ